MNKFSKTSFSFWAIVTAITLTAVTLYLMGRGWICDCGTVKLWQGVDPTSEGSQHITDWYTPSHIIHGILFYGLLHVLWRKSPVGWRAFLAVIIEAAWEIVENTNYTINRYRETTIALDYFGDSIVNSVADILWMLLGFWLARRLPIWATISLVILFEAIAMWVIRDGLALNVIMLLSPIDAIKTWQMGG